MKKLLTLITLTFIICSLSAQAEEHNDFPNHLIENISYTPTSSLEIEGRIFLSTGSEWRTKCNYDDELILDEWETGDEIFLFTGEHQGITLHNTRSNTKIIGSICKESIDNLPSIVDIQSEFCWWLLRTEYFITLSDGTEWKTILYQSPSYRWKIGQKVIPSNNYFLGELINLSIFWEKGYQDDRSLIVEKL